MGATPEQQAENLDAAVVCPECGRPMVLVVAPAMWYITKWAEGPWCLAQLWGSGDYPVSKYDRAFCNSGACKWTGKLEDVKVRRNDGA